MSLLQLLQSSATPLHQRNKVYGVVTGIVKDIRDPDGLGRVKVDFPWLGEEAEAVNIESGEERAHSYWARLALLMAGKDRGSFFIPEVGDEVLVAFEHGDLDRPFVLGGLWNKDDPPHETMDTDGKNHVRSLKSRSGHVLHFDDDIEEKKARICLTSQGGHQITLDDEDDEGKIEVVTKGGHKIVLDDAGKKITVTDSGDNKLVLDADAGSVTLECSGNHDQKAGGDLTIEATGSATIKAPGGLTIDSSSIKLGSSAALTLVNDTFLDIFNTHFHAGNLGAPTSPPTIPAVKNVQSTMTTKGA